MRPVMRISQLNGKARWPQNENEKKQEQKHRYRITKRMLLEKSLFPKD